MTIVVMQINYTVFGFIMDVLIGSVWIYSRFHIHGLNILYGKVLILELGPMHILRYVLLPALSTRQGHLGKWLLALFSPFVSGCRELEMDPQT